MKFGIFELVAAVIVIAVLLAAAPPAQEPPIIGPAPCNSDTPWACFDHHVFMPMVGREN